MSRQTPRKPGGADVDAIAVSMILRASATSILGSPEGLGESVTAELRQDDDVLCVDLGKLGGFCGDKLSESSPIAHGTSTTGGPDSPVYVFGAALDSVETVDVRVDDTTYTPDLVPVGDDSFWDVRERRAPPGPGRQSTQGNGTCERHSATTWQTNRFAIGQSVLRGRQRCLMAFSGDLPVQERGRSPEIAE